MSTFPQGLVPTPTLPIRPRTRLRRARRPGGGCELLGEASYCCFLDGLLAHRSGDRDVTAAGLADEGHEASAEQGQAEGAEADGQGDDAGGRGAGSDGATSRRDGGGDNGLAVGAEDLEGSTGRGAVGVNALGVLLGGHDHVVAGLAL